MAPHLAADAAMPENKCALAAFRPNPSAVPTGTEGEALRPPSG
jgi:hypothetical protein